MKSTSTTSEPVYMGSQSNLASWSNGLSLETYKRGIVLGMATGRVRAGFFHTRTRPAGLSPKLEPGPFINRVFSLEPGPASAGPRGPRGPRQALLDLGLIRSPTKKKKKNLNGHCRFLCAFFSF